MIRSELIQKLSEENPHLYQRDVERIVNAIFEEIIEAIAISTSATATMIKNRYLSIRRMVMAAKLRSDLRVAVQAVA